MDFVEESEKDWLTESLVEHLAMFMQRESILGPSEHPYDQEALWRSACMELGLFTLPETES